MGEEKFSFQSIEEIHDALQYGKITPREAYDYIQADSKADKVIKGAEDDYHNLSIYLIKHNCELYAAQITLMGAKEYPCSVTLWADVIKYSQKINNRELCNEALQSLQKIPRKYWEWRTFVFVIDFYKDSLGSAESIAGFEKNLKKAQKLIAEFKDNIPHEERAYVAEAEIYQIQGEFDKAIKTLETGIEKISVAPQCCLTLVDMYLERGRYDDVVRIAKIGIRASAQDQPSVSTAYLYYTMSLAMDALWTDKHEKYDPRDIITKYRIAQKLFEIEERSKVVYMDTIKSRIAIIQMEEGITDGSAQDTNSLKGLSDEGGEIWRDC